MLHGAVARKEELLPVLWFILHFTGGGILNAELNFSSQLKPHHYLSINKN